MDNETISVKELQQLLNLRKPVFILDVRPKAQRDEWYIEGSLHKDAYEKLNSGDRSVLDGLEVPTEGTVVTVCAAGRVSNIAADILREKGHKALSLEGGMKAWNYAWNTAEALVEGSDVRIIQVRRVAKGCLSYVVGSADEAIVIDASLDPQVYMDIARTNHWQIRYVMDTHIHADYLSRTAELSKVNGAAHIFIDVAQVGYSFVPVRNEDILRFGNTSVSIMHTPGHTKESVTYLLENKAAFTGDTLFTDGVGRPDLKADLKEARIKSGQLYDSIQRILAIGEDTRIFPAHISTTVAFDSKLISGSTSALKNSLDILKMAKGDFIETTMNRIPPTPPNYMTIAELNKSGSREGIIPADLEAGANRCAVSSY